MAESKTTTEYKYEPKPEPVDLALFTASLLFPYVLIPLSVWRARANKHLNYRKGYHYKMISFQLFTSFISYLVYGFFFNSILSYIFAVLIVSLLLFFILTGIYMRRSEWYIKLVEQYKQIIFVHGIRRISEIAEQVRQPQLNVEKDMEYLMSIGHFPEGALVEGVLRFKQDSANKSDEVLGYSVTNQGETTPSAQQSHVVECRGCGSKLILRSEESKECEYCGLLVQSVS